MPLYDEPGLLRVGVLNRSKLPGNKWIFDLPDETALLVVSARKDNWLRVFYDDAGREAWIDPRHKGRFIPWEQYLRMRTCHMLPGLQSKYYRLQRHQGGNLTATLTPKQIFKVLTIENAWAQVLTDQEMIGWVRWRDEDGRLLVGINP